MDRKGKSVCQNFTPLSHGCVDGRRPQRQDTTITSKKDNATCLSTTKNVKKAYIAEKRSFSFIF